MKIIEALSGKQSKVDNLEILEQMLSQSPSRQNGGTTVYETGKREVRETPLFKNGIGEVTRMFIPGGADFHARIRPAIEMIYVENGELAVSTDNGLLLIQSGQSHIFPPNVDHMVHAHTDTALIVAVFPQTEAMVDDG